jgi:glycerol dehydrogenase
MIVKTLIAPRRYVQGPGVLDEIGKYLAPLGHCALLVWDQLIADTFGKSISASLAAHNVEPMPFVFSGECDRGQIAKGIEMAKAQHADMVVGIGGGKAIDLAKAVAWDSGCKIVTVPTIASNDAPTSSFTVYYTPEGVMDGWAGWPANPDLVLVDSKVIANAPVRWLVSGMGDALTTWFEAEASFKSRHPVLAGGGATMTAMSLARLCYETLMTYGLDAKRDCELQIVTPAVEKVIEANTLLSGLGFESGGVCTAHAVGNGLTAYPECHSFTHGEKVAFGLASQLCMDDDIDVDERNAVFDFMISVGLPVTFEDLNLANVTREKVFEMAEAFVGPGSIAHNHAFPVTGYGLGCAMLAADALGKERKTLRLA